MEKVYSKLVLILAVVFMCLILFSVETFASGFGIFTQDSSGTSQAAAVVAHGDNPSAVFYNPALINQLPGTQVEIGTTLLIPTREFKSDRTGETTKTASQLFFPSSFYVTHAVTDKFSVGFGVFNPYGLATKWPDNWEGRYIATKSELTTFAFNPVVSIKVAPWLTVAGGVVYMTFDSKLERNLNFSPFALPDGTQKFHATGDGFGFNLGLLVEPVKDLSVGMTYRSRVHTDLNGNISFEVPAAGASFLSPLFPNGTATTKLVLPAQATAGIAYKVSAPLTVEVATRWEEWSVFKQLDVQLARPILGNTTDVISERNWRNTWSGMIGAKYQISQPIAIMGGYLYQMGAVPADTFEPAIPDSNGHLFTVGAGIKVTKALNVDVGYGYQILTKRTKNNAIDDNPSDGVVNPATAANGSYQSHIHLMSLNLTCKF